MAQNSQLLESGKLGARVPADVVALDPRHPGRTQSREKYVRVLQLSDLLSRNLEVEQIIEVFMAEIAAEVDFCGYRFAAEEGDLTIGVGRSDDYSASYRLKITQRLLGELTLYKRRVFTAEELCALEDLLCALLYPLRNALLYRLALESAYRDPLTGLNNRAALEDEIGREIDLARRHQRSLALLVMDLDGFKQINDRYGHDIGDEVLRRVAGVIGDVLRNSDLLFRYGGDEFVAGLAQTDLNGALDVCERIRTSVAAIDLGELGVDAGVRISIGVSLVRQEDRFATLFKRSDKALYQAKLSGRDQVIIC